MNKLISKNPVQRFKLGNRIIKAAGGIKTFAPVNETIGRYVREKNRSLFGQGWRWYDTTAPVGKSHMALDQEVEENGWILKPDGSKIKASLRNRQYQTVPSITPKTVQTNTEIQQTTPKSDIANKSGQLGKSNRVSNVTKPAAVTNNNGLKLFNKIGVDRTYTRANDRFANITQGQKDILNTLGISGNNALELQKSINSYLSKNGLGGIAEDNKWGGQSQAALDYILNSTDAGIQAPAALRKENLESVNYSTPVQVTPVVQTPEVIQAPAIQLNRKQTRQRMRDLGLNPYDYTGEQRRALRRFWNGDDSQDISFLRLKNGGLISKNPITRFKQRFV